MQSWSLRRITLGYIRLWDNRDWLLRWLMEFWWTLQNFKDSGRKITLPLWIASPSVTHYSILTVSRQWWVWEVKLGKIHRCCCYSALWAAQSRSVSQKWFLSDFSYLLPCADKRFHLSNCSWCQFIQQRVIDDLVRFAKATRTTSSSIERAMKSAFTTARPQSRYVKI